MKWKHFTILVILILSLLWVCGCIGSDMDLRVDKMDSEPDEFVNISELKMENFPSLKKAIQAIQSEKDYVVVEIPQEEYQELNSLLNTNNTNNISYKNEYYFVRFGMP